MVASRSGHVSLPNASLYYDTTGVGEPIVLVHGFSFDSRMWDGQVAAWSQHHQVIRYDMRGFGRSSAVDTPYAHAEDLMRLIHSLGVPRATVVGLSLGGGVAINFALAYPQAVRALVLADPTLGGVVRSPDSIAVATAVQDTARNVGLDAGRALWLLSPLFAPAMARPDAAATLRMMVNAYSGWHWLNDDPDVALNPPPCTRLGEIHAPTLVIVGEQDVPDFHDIRRALEHGIQGATSLVMAGSGHVPNLEVPDRFNAAVLDFLREISVGQCSS
ncbi:MAG: alpha/beta fold hydrolase [Vicinamibacterales bacterium]